MKLKLLGMVAGTALMALQSTNALARTDVVVGVQIGIPVPVVVTHYPAHYHWQVRAPVRHYGHRDYRPRHASTRYQVRCHERHDRGRHRGHGRGHYR